MADGTVNDVANSGNAKKPPTPVAHDAHAVGGDAGRGGPGLETSCPRCRQRTPRGAEACGQCGFSFCETCSTPEPLDGPHAADGSHSLQNGATYDVESLIGTVIDKKYRVLKVLGEGGFGVVYGVEFLLFDERQEFALKVLHPSLSANAAFRRRFMREARLAMSFAHENAIQIRSFGQTDNGLLYLTMDLSHGESLKSVMRRDGVFSVARAVDITRQVLAAVRVAHGRGVLHRDLKPENIFIERDVDGNERVKVGDFGLAKSLEPVNGVSDEITWGGVVGSPRYMSPEQSAGRDVDVRTDLYSIGLVLYELLFGTVPQTEQIENEIARVARSRAAALRGQAESAEAIVVPPDIVPEGLLAILRTALALDRRTRHASAEDFLAALDVVARRVTRRAAFVGRLRRGFRSRAFLRRTLPLGVACLVVFSAVFLVSPGKRATESTLPRSEFGKIVDSGVVPAADASEPINVRDYAALRTGVQYEYDVEVTQGGTIAEDGTLAQDGTTTRSRLRLEVVVNLDPGKFLVRAKPGDHEYFLVIDDEQNALYREFKLPDPETGERRLTKSRLLLQLPSTTSPVSEGRTFSCSSADDERQISVRLLEEPVEVHGRSFADCIEVVDIDIGNGERQVRYYKKGKGEVATKVFDLATGARLYSRVLLDDQESTF